MNILKQSTAATIKLGPFVDDTDGKTAETALTIGQADIRLSKNGGDIAQSHNTAGATHDELGYYDIPLDTTDTGTLGRLRVLVSKAGALPVWQDFLIVTANVFDTFCSTGSLNVNAVSLSTDAITAASVKADAVTKIQSGLALEATLTAIKGAGWSTETLAAIDVLIDAIKAKTDLIPATPAVADEYDAALAAIQADLDNPNQYKADVSALMLASSYVAPNNAGITAIKAKTDNLPANTATALAAIQSDLDNPAQYKADVSGLATTAHVQEVENKIDAIDVTVNTIPTNPLLDTAYTAPDNASIAAILEDTGTTLPATLAGLATSAEVGAIAMLDEVVVGSYTMQDILKILAAKMVGKATGGSTATITYRGVDDTSDVIVETVDSNGNRSAVTLTV